MLTEVTDQKQWNELVEASPYGHPLQLWEWGELKRLNGWEPRRWQGEHGAAQVLFWPIPGTGFKVAYVPRGPVADPTRAAGLLRELAELVRTRKALYLKVEPAWPPGTLPHGWRRSRQPVLMSETYTINLRRDQTEIMADMRPKARQYMRKAEAEGVKVRRVTSPDELADFWRIYADTAKRAGFGLHDFDYYKHLFELAPERNFVAYAEVGSRPEAFVWLMTGGGVAFELYGGMTAAGAAARANYLLKWRAIEAMQAAGLSTYDFNGRLNEGVSQFKANFGPAETDYIGSLDLPFNFALYNVLVGLWPVLKPVGRRLIKLVRR